MSQHLSDLKSSTLKVHIMTMALSFRNMFFQITAIVMTHISPFHSSWMFHAAHISASWTEMSCWMLNDHQLNLAKTELRKFSVNPTLMLQLTNINFTDHIALARSCKFALYNIRKIRTFLTGMLQNFLSKLLFSPN